jgi:hypothetical protein
MIFFTAKGPADSCGHGCNEWISAVGVFDAGTSQRFRDFIEKLNGRNLPIFFHSPGGSIKTAIEVGYLLRERRMSAGIGRTDTKCRVFDKRAGCQKLFKDGGPIARRYFLDLGVDPSLADIEAKTPRKNLHSEPKRDRPLRSPRQPSPRRRIKKISLRLFHSLT